MHIKKIGIFFLIGMLAAFIITKAIFLLCWIAYVPFFILWRQVNGKQAVMAGIAFSLGISVISFAWMVSTAVSFSGNGWFYGALVTSVSAVIFATYWTSLFLLINKLKKDKTSKWIRALFVASCFTLGEHLLALAFGQMPYYLFNSGYALLNNLYTTQWSSFFGLSFLGFVVVFVNFIIAEIITSKTWVSLVWPMTILVALLGGGFLIKFTFDQHLTNGKAVKIAIAAENIPADLRWDESGGNILAQRLLALNTRASSLGPDIVLWSETTIPWAYRPDDELLLELLKAPYPKNTAHIIGFMSNHSQKKMYNSVYGISGDGKKLGRYDKKYLLDFVETPFLNLNMPFRDLDGYLIAQGYRNLPIPTPGGSAGIVICNEVVKPEATISMVKNGAEFLLNLSNDGWFRNSEIVHLHFLYAKLSAVINRKDIVVNSNNGISGGVRANGEVLSSQKSEQGYVELVQVNPNNYKNRWFFQSLVPALSAFIILGYFLMISYRRYKESRVA